MDSPQCRYCRTDLSTRSHIDSTLCTSCEKHTHTYLNNVRDIVFIDHGSGDLTYDRGDVIMDD